jgi:hypothetical protein
MPAAPMPAAPMLAATPAAQSSTAAHSASAPLASAMEVDADVQPEGNGPHQLMRHEAVSSTRVGKNPDRSGAPAKGDSGTIAVHSRLRYTVADHQTYPRIHQMRARAAPSP